jgi:host factor-I protein
MDADSSHDKQADFFNRARKEPVPVTIYLTNGKKLTGRIRSFDRFTVVLESNRVEQLIFKHAISTVALGRPGPSGDPGPAGPARAGRRAGDEPDADADEE